MEATGLTQAEAAKRLKARGPHVPQASSRSYGSIVRANVFTVFNLVLLVFGVITLVFGAWQDALFLLILVANSAIGIAQEIRAKNALDHLAALVTPTARVLRDGEVRESRSRTWSSTMSSASGPATSWSPMARSPRRAAFGSTSRSSPARPTRWHAGPVSRCARARSRSRAKARTS